MERRTALQIISICLLNARVPGVASSAELCGPGPDFSPEHYQPQFFSRDELSLVDRMMEIIIPSDDRSPGAHAANTAQFADFMLADSPIADQAVWKEALKALKTKLDTVPIEQLMREIAADEINPKTAEGHFFVALKLMTVDGYYTSAIGIHQDLQYKGNEYLMSFSGCANPEEH